jgi:plastocyanin domain-containing protein
LAGIGISINGINNQTPVANTQVKTSATIYIGPVGYTPNNITLKSHSKITLNLFNKDSYTCASAFTIPDLGIQKVVQPGTSAKIQFTTPDKPTDIAFMCSMGMFKGIIHVI